MDAQGNSTEHCFKSSPVNTLMEAVWQSQDLKAKIWFSLMSCASFVIKTGIEIQGSWGEETCT